MVLISIRPFAFWRSVIFGVTLVGLSIATAFSQPFLVSVNQTPYDHQMERIQPVLVTVANAAERDITLTKVNHWVQDLRQIPYGYSLQWKTPYEVATDPVADCKGKAVSLYRTMRDHGAKNIRLVIGKRAPTSRVTHTWVEWKTPSGSYVLDPTINWRATSVGDLPSRSYVPLFAYAGARKFRAVAPTTLLARL